MGHRRIAYVSVYHGEQFSLHRYLGLAAAFTVAGVPGGVTAYTLNEFAEIPDGEAPLSSFLGRSEWKKMNKSIRTFLHLCPNKRSIATLTFALSRMRRDEVFRLACMPIFEQALSDPATTAWVCANDYMALLALDFLHVHNKRVPEDISLVGFDDSFSAIQYNLTSYSCNIPMFLHRTLHFIINPSSDAQANKNKPIEVPGHIMVRESLGPAPGRS